MTLWTDIILLLFLYCTQYFPLGVFPPDPSSFGVGSLLRKRSTDHSLAPSAIIHSINFFTFGLTVLSFCPGKNLRSRLTRLFERCNYWNAFRRVFSLLISIFFVIAFLQDPHQHLFLGAVGPSQAIRQLVLLLPPPFCWWIGVLCESWEHCAKVYWWNSSLSNDENKTNLLFQPPAPPPPPWSTLLRSLLMIELQNAHCNSIFSWSHPTKKPLKFLSLFLAFIRANLRNWRITDYPIERHVDLCTNPQNTKDINLSEVRRSFLEAAIQNKEARIHWLLF